MKKFFSKHAEMIPIFVVAILLVVTSPLYIAGTSTQELRYDINTKQCAQYVDMSQLYIDGTAASSIKTLAQSAVPTTRTVGGNALSDDISNAQLKASVIAATMYTSDVTATGDYLYLSAAEKTIATQAATTSLSGYLSSTDWNTFDGKADLVSPSFTTPSLGVATATSINKVDLTAPATGSTLTIADGKTLTASNTLTFEGTDASTLDIGTGGTLGTAAYTATGDYEASGAIATHADLQNVHGLAITADKTLTVSNSLTLSGTDASTLDIGTGGTLGTAAYTATSAYAAALGGDDNYVTDAEKVIVSNQSGVVKGNNYTADADDDTSGAIVIATGLATITTFHVTIVRGGAVLYSDQAVSISNGNLTVGDGSGYAITTGDVIYWIAVGTVS